MNTGTQTNKDKHVSRSIASTDGLPLFAITQPPPSPKILRMPEVIERVGLRRASIYRRIKEDDFPKAISLGPRAVGWLEHEINGWLLQRQRARDMSLKHWEETRRQSFD